MAAYLISDITVRDLAAFEIYRTRAAEAIHTHGGRYLARLGEVQVLEGSWNPNMIVIVEFPNLEQARAWYLNYSRGSCLPAIGRDPYSASSMMPRVVS
jgi:uncharacterized protein (DUF1330 family)